MDIVSYIGLPYYPLEGPDRINYTGDIDKKIINFFDTKVMPRFKSLGRIGVERIVSRFQTDFLKKAATPGTDENRLWEEYIKDILYKSGKKETSAEELYNFYEDLKENPRALDAVSDLNKINHPVKSPFKLENNISPLRRAARKVSFEVDFPNSIQGASTKKIGELQEKLQKLYNETQNKEFRKKIDNLDRDIIKIRNRGKRGVKTKMEIPIKINVKGIKDYKNDVLGGENGVDYYTHLYNIPIGEKDSEDLDRLLLSKYMLDSKYQPTNRIKKQELVLLKNILEKNGILSEEIKPSSNLTRGDDNVSVGDWYSLNNTEEETFHKFQDRMLPGVSVRDFLAFILNPEDFEREMGFEKEDDDKKWYTIKYQNGDEYPIYGLPADIDPLDPDSRYEKAFLPDKELGPDQKLKNKNDSDLTAIKKDLEQGDRVGREVLDKTLGSSSKIYEKLSNPDNLYVGKEIYELFNRLSTVGSSDVIIPTNRSDAYNFMIGLQGLRKYFRYEDGKGLTKVPSVGRDKSENKGLRYEHVIPMKVLGSIVMSMYNASKDNPDFDLNKFIKEASEVVEKLYTIAWIDIDKDNQLDFAGLKSDMGSDWGSFIEELSTGKIKIQDISEDDLWNKILSRYRKAGILGANEKLFPVSQLPKVKKVPGGIEFPFYNIYFSERRYSPRRTNESKTPKLTSLIFGYYG